MTKIYDIWLVRRWLWMTLGTEHKASEPSAIAERNEGSKMKGESKHHLTFVHKCLPPWTCSPNERYINAGLGLDKLDKSGAFEHISQDKVFLSLWVACLHLTQYVNHIAGSDHVNVSGKKKCVIAWSISQELNNESEREWDVMGHNGYNEIK